MERIQGPHAADAEALAERDRVQAELQAAQRTVEALEQQLADKSADLVAWQERAFKGPPPQAWWVIQAVLGGALLGAGVATALYLLSGWGVHLG